MLRLKLFGVPALERGGGVVSGRAAQRHRLALLALLALAPGRRLGRDRLIALLWPESDAERGRNLLKVATYVVRSALGDGALVSTGDELRLDAELVEVDVARFEDAMERGEHACAAALYEGPFMDGFFLSEAPEFERWVDRERERLAGGYRKTLEALATAAEDARDLPAAVEWWKARAVQDPYDSRVALRLMQALQASGNRAGALQHAAIHQKLLQAEFGVDSAPEVAAFAERLRREPPTELAPASRAATSMQAADAPEEAIPERPPALALAPALPAPVSAPALPAPVPAPAGASVRPARRFAVAALLCMLVLAGALLALRPYASSRERSIAVLPFVDLGASRDTQHFGDGLTEEIITRLAVVPELKVISRTSAMHYRGSRKPLPQIAAELRVDHILEGSVRHDDGRVRISAQLIDARADRHLWAEHYEYELRDAFRIQEDIARDVARALEVKLGRRARRLLARQGTSDPVAYQLYRRGRSLWNTRTAEGHAQAIEHFGRAIARDSSYADAYAGLAGVYLTSFQLDLGDTTEAETYSRLTWAAERALALDDESADAHVSFAIALWWQRNWPGAARELRRAIELNPGHATARSWYSLLLRGMGQGEEARRQSRRAAELDPFAVVATHNHAWQCYVARDHDRAMEQYRRSLAIGPYPGSYRGLALVHAQQARPDSALHAMRRAIALAPRRTDFLADLAYVQALAGRTAEARATLGRAKAAPREPFNVARAHLALGERDSAFAWLERSNWRWPHRAARDDPALDAVRGDPRFAALWARVEREMGLR